MKTTEEQHEKRNDLTDVKCYKRVNIQVIDAYNALHPPTLSKLSIAIFTVIMDTKLHRQPGAKDYSSAEDKRIYNNKFVTLEDILDRCYPEKYGILGKSMANDLSNLMGRLNELDTNNIFYIWRYGKPYSYMFIMERDIGLWKYFNPNAVLTPKTLKKVIAGFSGMVDTMVKFEKLQNRPVELSKVEASFVEDLIPHLMSKMAEDVAKKLPQWDKQKAIVDYLTELKDALNKTKKYEGLDEDQTFHQRLPRHLVAKIDAKPQPQKEEKMDFAALSKSLVPDNEDLVSSSKTKIRRTKISCGSPEPKRTTFQSVDPFANCNQLMQYYRESIRLYNKSAKFYSFETERKTATQVIDLLIQNGKNGDIDFLRSWINYYIGSYLQGSNVYKPDKTSLSSFKKTFQTYEGKYFRA